MGPSLKSEANIFVAPTTGNKEVINFRIFIFIFLSICVDQSFKYLCILYIYIYIYIKILLGCANYLLCVGNMEKE